MSGVDVDLLDVNLSLNVLDAAVAKFEDLVHHHFQDSSLRENI